MDSRSDQPPRPRHGLTHVITINVDDRLRKLVQEEVAKAIRRGATNSFRSVRTLGPLAGRRK